MDRMELSNGPFWQKPVSNSDLIVFVKHALLIYYLYYPYRL